MSLQEAITLNVILILCLAFLALFFWTPGERTFGFLWVGWITFCLSISGWTIYVAVHFITKYW